MTALADRFETVHQKKVDTKNGTILLDYISWSQVADRLDEAAPGWSFAIIHLGDDWVHGRLSLDDRHFENVGYAENADQAWKKEALKDAVSDALKRCAAMAGVGRYLYDKDAPRQNGHSAPLPVAAPARSSTAIPDELDVLDWDELSPAPPKAAPRSGGTMWSKDLFERAEAASIDKKQISDTAKRMWGRDKWKVTELTDGERFALAVELGIA